MTLRDPNTLLPREVLFVDAYVGEAAGVASQAAKIAGYGGGAKGEAWKVQGHKILNRARVREAIAKRRAEIAQLEREAAELVKSEKLAELVKKRQSQLMGAVLSTAELQRLWSAIAMGEVGDGPVPTYTERLMAARDLAKSLGIFVHENELPPAPVRSDEDGTPRVVVQMIIVNNGRGPAPPVLPTSTEGTKP